MARGATLPTPKNPRATIFAVAVMLPVMFKLLALMLPVAVVK